MIARHRGDARAHSRWRPSAPAAATSGLRQPRQAFEQQPQAPVNEPTPLELGQRPRRGSRALIAVVTVGVIAIIAGRQHAGPAPAASRLPSTPSVWIEQWTAASLDNPGRVCNRLFAPALAAAFRRDTGRSCVSYYGSVKSSSFRIRRVIQDGGTATVEAQQVARGRTRGYFTVVLSQLHGGWQAVDIVPGGPVRPR